MYFVYGDDFRRLDSGKITLIHAAFGIKENEAIKLSDFLKKFKEQIKINSIHCRILFNEPARKKNMVNYTSEQIFQIYSHILHFITELGNIPPPLITVAKYDEQKWKEILEVKNISMSDKDGKESLVNFSVNENTIKFHLEQVNNLRLFSMLGSDYIFHREKIDKEHCAQKIGEYKNRGVMPGMRFPNDLSPEARLPNLVKYEDAPYKEIYEISDFIAYVCGTVLHQGSSIAQKRDEVFRNWYSHLNPLVQEFSPTFC